VRHEPRGCRAMPVMLTGLEEDTVTGADQLDRAAAALAEAHALVTQIVCPFGCVCKAVTCPWVK